MFCRTHVCLVCEGAEHDPKGCGTRLCEADGEYDAIEHFVCMCLWDMNPHLHSVEYMYVNVSFISTTNFNDNTPLTPILICQLSLIDQIQSTPNSIVCIRSQFLEFELCMCICRREGIPLVSTCVYYFRMIMCTSVSVNWCTIKDARTPLIVAAQEGHLEVVKYLVTEAKADPNQPTKVI